MRLLWIIAVLLIALMPAALAESPAATAQEFALRLSEHAARIEDSFEIACTESVRRQLLAESALGRKLLSEISENCGLITFSYRETRDGLQISSCVYYEGLRMLYAARTGDTGFLTSREQQALAVARQIAAGAQGTDLERERYLHDALCQRTQYHTDGSSSRQERDCAIGPLLNGQADCDGYADAFYLLGGLSGLEVRYQHGDTMTRDEDAWEGVSIQEGSHMWNLIRLDGRWMMVDVTWDDSNVSPNYNYFNFGTDQATATHTWDAAALPVQVAAVTGNESRPADLARQYVGSWEDVYACLRSAAGSRAGYVGLETPLGLRQNREYLSSLIYAVGAVDYKWAFADGRVEIFDIAYADCFAICETEQQAEAFLQQCAAQNIRQFRVCFGPVLGPQMMANDFAGVERLIARSQLLETGFSYSEKSWYIEIKNAGYSEALPQFDRLDALLDYARQQAMGRAASFTVVLAGSLSVNQVTQPIADALYCCGVNDVSYMTSGARLTAKDISYYPEYASVQSRQEALDYLNSCRWRGVSSLRLYLPDALFYELRGDERYCTGFSELLQQAGVSDSRIRYNDSYCCFVVDNIVW